MTLTKQPPPIGEKFYRLTVIEEVEPIGSRRRVRCRCDCGKHHVVDIAQIKHGNVRSCGCASHDAARRVCIERNTTHGQTGTRFYIIWKQMRRRGLNPTEVNKRWYGENGVGLHAPWKEFEAFQGDMHVGYLEHSRAHGEGNTTLDRLDNSKGYFPDNVRWATFKQQSRNQDRVPKYEFQGQSRSLAEWAEHVGVDACTLKMRLRIGWTVERALTTPVKPSKRGKWDRKSRQVSERANDEQAAQGSGAVVGPASTGR